MLAARLDGGPEAAEPKVRFRSPGGRLQPHPTRCEHSATRCPGPEKCLGCGRQSSCVAVGEIARSISSGASGRNDSSGADNTDCRRGRGNSHRGSSTGNSGRGSNRFELPATVGIIRAAAVVTGAAAAFCGTGAISIPATIMTDSRLRRMHILPMVSDTNHRPDRHGCYTVFAVSPHRVRGSGENVPPLTANGCRRCGRPRIDITPDSPASSDRKNGAPNRTFGSAAIGPPTRTATPTRGAVGYRR
jgi:hypothetical protein